MARHKRGLIVSGALALGLAQATLVVHAHLGDGGDPAQIHACLHERGGRIVGPAGVCKKSELPVHWSIASAGGPISKSCPAGEFVTGFDAIGELICEVPLIVLVGTLNFNSQGFDLETGLVFTSSDPREPFPPAVDFTFAFDSGTPNHVRLFQERENGVQIAFLDGTPFSSVARSIIPTLTFTADLVDVPFDNDDTIVIMTPARHVFKVGNPRNGDLSIPVVFNYAQLQ